MIQGSTCHSVHDAAKASKMLVDTYKVVRLDVEKYALNKDTKECPTQYLRNNTVRQRIQDYLQVIQNLRGHSWWNGKLFIIGGSEGGVIAPILASFVPETNKTVIMAGGIGWTLKEEILYLEKKRLISYGKNQDEVEYELNKIVGVFEEAIQNPTSSRTFMGETNTYKWWDSILNLKPIVSMTQLQIPILMVHGDQDLSAPVESAQEAARQFQRLGKNNLTYVEYPGLDHSWKDKEGKSHSARVIQDVLKWLF